MAPCPLGLINGCVAPDRIYYPLVYANVMGRLVNHVRGKYTDICYSYASLAHSGHPASSVARADKFDSRYPYLRTNVKTWTRMYLDPVSLKMLRGGL